MFETTTTFSALAADRLGRWGRIIAVSAVMLGPWFTLSAQADVDQADVDKGNLVNVLTHAVEDVLGFSDYSRNVAVGQVLQRLVRRPDGSFDTFYATRLGFDPPPSDVEAAVQQASSSSPIAVFRIGLKRLKDYKHGVTDPLTLLAADANWLILPSPPFPPLHPARFLFPITVKDPPPEENKRVKSSVLIQANLTSDKLDFEIERFGSSTLIRQIDKRRRDLTTDEIDPTYFLVWIPALDRYYLGRLLKIDPDDLNKMLHITAIENDRQFGLTVGLEVDARKVFPSLHDEALTIDADDPDAPPR